MSKRILLLILSVCVCLMCACSMVREDAANLKTEYEIVPLAQEIDLTPGISVNAVLYFPNRNGTKLTAQTHKVEVAQDQRVEDAILKALFLGTDAQDLRSLSQGLLYDRVEVLSDVVNVYLLSKHFVNDSDLLQAKLAIASTLADFTGMKYVNVFVDGRQAGYQGTPTGALRKSNDLLEDMTAYGTNSEAQNPTMNATLYFLDPSESYLLAETRSITFRNDSNLEPESLYAQELVRQLIQGPENTYNHLPSIDPTMQLFEPPTIVERGGQRILHLNFKGRMPAVYTQGYADGQRLAIAALTHTLFGFLPNIDGMEIYVDGMERAATLVYRPEQFEDLKGKEILLYLPNSDYSLLSGVERVVQEAQAPYLETLLLELMKGPVSRDSSTIMPAFPAGITQEQINEVYLAGDIAVVDFSGEVAQPMQTLSEDDEYLWLYSIVNTLTNMPRVKRVQFLLDGERVAHLGKDVFYVMDPLLKNPGIIKY